MGPSTSLIFFLDMVSGQFTFYNSLKNIEHTLSSGK